jgi:hypothetical protein
MALRISFILLVALLALTASCDVIQGNVALSGPKRYKSELSALALQMKDEIDQKGEISGGTDKKLAELMTNWEPEMGKLGSFIKLRDIRASMDEIKANPSVQFKKNQQIALDISDMLEILKTEVKD